MLSKYFRILRLSVHTVRLRCGHVPMFAWLVVSTSLQSPSQTLINDGSMLTGMTTRPRPRSVMSPPVIHHAPCLPAPVFTSGSVTSPVCPLLSSRAYPLGPSCPLSARCFLPVFTSGSVTFPVCPLLSSRAYPLGPSCPPSACSFLPVFTSGSITSPVCPLLSSRVHLWVRHVPRLPAPFFPCSPLGPSRPLSACSLSSPAHPRVRHVPCLPAPFFPCSPLGPSRPLSARSFLPRAHLWVRHVPRLPAPFFPCSPLGLSCPLSARSFLPVLTSGSVTSPVCPLLSSRAHLWVRHVPCLPAPFFPCSPLGPSCPLSARSFLPVLTSGSVTSPVCPLLSSPAHPRVRHVPCLPAPFFPCSPPGPSRPPSARSFLPLLTSGSVTSPVCPLLSSRAHLWVHHVPRLPAPFFPCSPLGPSRPPSARSFLPVLTSGSRHVPRLPAPFFPCSPLGPSCPPSARSFLPVLTSGSVTSPVCPLLSSRAHPLGPSRPPSARSFLPVLTSGSVTSPVCPFLSSRAHLWVHHIPRLPAPFFPCSPLGPSRPPSARSFLPLLTSGSITSPVCPLLSSRAHLWVRHVPLSARSFLPVLTSGSITSPVCPLLSSRAHLWVRHVPRLPAPFFPCSPPGPSRPPSARSFLPVLTSGSITSPVCPFLSSRAHLWVRHVPRLPAPFFPCSPLGPSRPPSVRSFLPVLTSGSITSPVCPLLSSRAHLWVHHVPRLPAPFFPCSPLGPSRPPSVRSFLPVLTSGSVTSPVCPLLSSRAHLRVRHVPRLSAPFFPCSPSGSITSPVCSAPFFPCSPPGPSRPPSVRSFLPVLTSGSITSPVCPLLSSRAHLWVRHVPRLPAPFFPCSPLGPSCPPSARSFLPVLTSGSVTSPVCPLLSSRAHLWVRHVPRLPAAFFPCSPLGPSRSPSVRCFLPVLTLWVHHVPRLPAPFFPCSPLGPSRPPSVRSFLPVLTLWVRHVPRLSAPFFPCSPLGPSRPPSVRSFLPVLTSGSVTSPVCPLLSSRAHLWVRHVPRLSAPFFPCSPLGPSCPPSVRSFLPVLTSGSIMSPVCPLLSSRAHLWVRHVPRLPAPFFPCSPLGPSCPPSARCFLPVLTSGSITSPVCPLLSSRAHLWVRHVPSPFFPCSPLGPSCPMSARSFLPMLTSGSVTSPLLSSRAHLWVHHVPCLPAPFFPCSPLGPSCPPSARSFLPVLTSGSVTSPLLSSRAHLWVRHVPCLPAPFFPCSPLGPSRPLCFLPVLTSGSVTSPVCPLLSSRAHLLGPSCPLSARSFLPVLTSGSIMSPVCPLLSSRAHPLGPSRPPSARSFLPLLTSGSVTSPVCPLLSSRAHLWVHHVPCLPVPFFPCSPLGPSCPLSARCFLPLLTSGSIMSPVCPLLSSRAHLWVRHVPRLPAAFFPCSPLGPSCPLSARSFLPVLTSGSIMSPVCPLLSSRAHLWVRHVPRLPAPFFPCSPLGPSCPLSVRSFLPVLTPGSIMSPVCPLLSSRAHLWVRHVPRLPAPFFPCSPSGSIMSPVCPLLSSPAHLWVHHVPCLPAPFFPCSPLGPSCPLSARSFLPVLTSGSVTSPVCPLLSSRAHLWVHHVPCLPAPFFPCSPLGPSCPLSARSFLPVFTSGSIMSPVCPFLSSRAHLWVHHVPCLPAPVLTSGSITSPVCPLLSSRAHLWVHLVPRLPAPFFPCSPLGPSCPPVCPLLSSRAHLWVRHVPRLPAPFFPCSPLGPSRPPSARSFLPVLTSGSVTSPVCPFLSSRAHLWVRHVPLSARSFLPVLTSGSVTSPVCPLLSSRAHLWVRHVPRLPAPFFPCSPLGPSRPPSARSFLPVLTSGSVTSPVCPLLSCRAHLWVHHVPRLPAPFFPCSPLGPSCPPVCPLLSSRAHLWVRHVPRLSAPFFPCSPLGPSRPPSARSFLAVLTSGSITSPVCPLLSSRAHLWVRHVPCLSTPFFPCSPLGPSRPLSARSFLPVLTSGSVTVPPSARSFLAMLTSGSVTSPVCPLLSSRAHLWVRHVPLSARSFLPVLTLWVHHVPRLPAPFFPCSPLGPSRPPSARSFLPVLTSGSVMSPCLSAPFFPCSPLGPSRPPSARSFLPRAHLWVHHVPRLSAPFFPCSPLGPSRPPVCPAPFFPCSPLGPSRPLSARSFLPVLTSGSVTSPVCPLLSSRAHLWVRHVPCLPAPFFPCSPLGPSRPPSARSFLPLLTSG